MSERTIEPWHLYLIRCRNGSLYAGITTNVEARYNAHIRGRGAKYTKANPPVCLVGSKSYLDKSSAAKAECAIRKLPANKKAQFLAEV